MAAASSGSVAMVSTASMSGRRAAGVKGFEVAQAHVAGVEPYRPSRLVNEVMRARSRLRQNGQAMASNRHRPAHRLQTTGGRRPA
jgi:uncharacterized linocin/CFP29 family protein